VEEGGGISRHRIPKPKGRENNLVSQLADGFDHFGLCRIVHFLTGLADLIQYCKVRLQGIESGNSALYFATLAGGGEEGLIYNRRNTS